MIQLVNVLSKPFASDVMENLLLTFRLYFNFMLVKDYLRISLSYLIVTNVFKSGSVGYQTEEVKGSRVKV